jgi:rod shape determining protein RodA
MFSLGHTFGKQLLFSALGILVIFFVQFPRVKVYERYSSIFYLIVLVLLVGLFVFGNEVSGAKSWYSVAGFSFQPAELAKVVTALALTKHLSEINTDLRNISHQISAFILILIPAFLILPQPDPGSTVVFLSFLLVLHTEKLPSRYILVFCGVVILFIITLLIGHNLTTYVVITIAVIYIIGMRNKKRRKVFLPTILVVLLASGFIQSVDYVFENVFEQRHRDRFNIVLGREVDTQGIGYNINQSQIAIGSGGMFGKGFLEGTQTKGNFVPEQQTDYIFTTVGEEWGFVGTFFVIVLFMVLMLRILFTSKRQKNKFSRIYCYSVVSLIFAHFSINLGMVLGLLPTIGIPLPFLSYGGSNLLAFSLLLGIYLKLDANRVNEW